MNGDGILRWIYRYAFHNAYFTSEYACFRQALQDLLGAASPEAFAGGDLASKMFILESAYDDKFGFYVDSDETGLVTLNSFLRHAKPDTRYYFGGTVDYHC